MQCAQEELKLHWSLTLLRADEHKLNINVSFLKGVWGSLEK